MKYRYAPLLYATLALGACNQPAQPSATETVATPAEARAFFDRFNEQQYQVDLDQGRAEWVMQTYITSDTEYLSAKASERALNFTNRMLEDAKRFQGLELDEDIAPGSASPDLCPVTPCTQGRGKSCPAGCHCQQAQLHVRPGQIL